MAKKILRPAHPGLLLKTEFLDAYGVSSYRVAKDMGIPQPRLNDILLGKRRISAEMAVLLARYFGTSDEFFMNLQCDYDRRIAASALADKLEKIKPLQKR